jgi:hypothetical protein
MRPPSGTGPPGIQVQRDFEGNRLAKDSQTRAYQKVLPVVRRSESQTGGTGQLGRDVDASLVGQEEVAA